MLYSYSFFLLFTLLVSVTYSIDLDWLDPTARNGPHYSDAKLYDSTEKSGLLSVEGHVGCFGDFNGDKYTDLYVVAQNLTMVQVYEWDSYEWMFKPQPNTVIVTEYPIANLVATDWNFDGKLDLLITGNLPNSSLYIHLHISSDHTYNNSYIELPAADDQFLLFDWDSDLYLDLLAMKDGELTVWHHFENGTIELRTDLGGISALSSPHSASFIDFNGDCHPDLFITTQNGNYINFEIWIWEDASTFTKKYTYDSLPLGVGQVTFMDFDRDGNIDMAFPVCYPSTTCSITSEIWIAYNNQLDVCSNSITGGSNCRDPEEMCVADNDFTFNFEQSDDNTDLVIVALPYKMYVNSAVPLTLRAGDYNIDGFPDILVPVNDDRVYTDIWNSASCSSSLNCTTSAISSKRRTFTKATKNVDALSALNNTWAATFFDLGDDVIQFANEYSTSQGNLGMIVLTDPTIEGKVGARGISGIYNNFAEDAFFVKALGSNGVCDQWCKSGDKYPPKPYGVNYPGAIFKFSFSDLSGDGLGSAGVQLYQSSYLPLLTPYVYIGLGRVSNYLQSVSYGISYTGVWSHYWLSVVPNSQIVCIPYPPEKDSKWKLELFLSTNGIMFWVIISIISCLIGLGGIILFFKWREKKEDAKEEKPPVF